ncbi:CorA metal ion transporter, partial [Lunasporangiospora selenospora]
CSGSGFSPDTSRSPSFTSDASPPRRAVDPTAAAAAAAAAAKDDVTPGHSAKSSPQLSERSSSSDDMNRTMKEEESLIMPRIITGAQEEQQPHTRPVDHSRGRTSLLAASPTAMDTMGPRMMTPSPVPLHARLSRIQKEARRGGARVLDMENSGASHHYDYEDVTDSSYDFSSRRHSVAEEDIPLDDAYRFTLYSTASVTIHAQTLGEIPPRGQTLSSMLQAGYFWLDVLAPTDEEIRMLSQVFRIHPLTTEDILMEEGREKCEMFLNYYFVCFRTFVLDPNSHNYLQPLSVYTLVFPEGIISYHFRPVPHCRNVRKRIRHLKERMEVTPDWINYAIIDDIVDTFAPLIRQVETEVDMIDELVLILKESEQADMLRRIGNCRKRVMSLLRLLTGKADVIKGLIKRYEGRNLSHYEKILSRSHSNYLAQINIEMTSASNETNDVLTKLTVLGSILLPMNLVTGLWGMNVPVPGQETEDLTWFFWIVTSIFLAAFLFLLIARKIKLL